MTQPTSEATPDPRMLVTKWSVSSCLHCGRRIRQPAGDGSWRHIEMGGVMCSGDGTGLIAENERLLAALKAAEAENKRLSRILWNHHIPSEDMEVL